MRVQLSLDQTGADTRMLKAFILILLIAVTRSSPTVEEHNTAMVPGQRSNDMFEEYMPSFVSSMVPQESRTGPVGVAIFGFIITAALLAMMPLTYFFGFLLGKYFIAPAVWSVTPFSTRSHHGRSLDNSDTDHRMLDDLTTGVMSAVNTYNLLQSLNK